MNERASEHLQESVGGEGDPEPNPGRRPETAAPAGGEPSPDRVAARRELADFVEPSWFPLDAGDLSERLSEAPAVLREAAQNMGPGHPVTSMVELLDAAIDLERSRRP